MLDPKVLKEEQDAVRAMLGARRVDFDLVGLLEANSRRLSDMDALDGLRRERNKMAEGISAAKKSGADPSGFFSSMKKISGDIASAEAALEGSAARYQRLAQTMPNMIHKSVPIGDESANAQVRSWGSLPELGFKARDHVTILEERGLADIARAAKASGARFYYLLGDLARLNQALTSCALDFMAERGYTLVQPPYMIKRSSMEGAVIAEDFGDVIYKIQDEDLYLIGTSEHAMAAMHSDEILDGKSLPIRYAGFSPCFRKEAGAHGRDQKGIFRVHQFDKIEQFVFCRPEDSWAEHERMLGIAEEFYQELGLPYKVVLLSSGDMGKVSAKTYDIEAWMAGQNAYREVVSCSNCLDYQARRLMVRFRDRTNDPTSYVHTLNSTVAATSRILVAILENFQQADGHISVPKALRPYMKKDQI